MLTGILFQLVIFYSAGKNKTRKLREQINSVTLMSHKEKKKLLDYAMQKFI